MLAMWSRRVPFVSAAFACAVAWKVSFVRQRELEACCSGGGSGDCSSGGCSRRHDGIRIRSKRVCWG